MMRNCIYIHAELFLEPQQVVRLNEFEKQCVDMMQHVGEGDDAREDLLFASTAAR